MCESGVGYDVQAPRRSKSTPLQYVILTVNHPTVGIQKETSYKK
jgi:hypothetical protein